MFKKYLPLYLLASSLEKDDAPKVVFGGKPSVWLVGRKKNFTQFESANFYIFFKFAYLTYVCIW